MDETASRSCWSISADARGRWPKRELARLLADGSARGRLLVRNGPVTPQDRWEEEPGYSPFTLAVEIAALLVAAELAEHAGEPGVARTCGKRRTSGTRVSSAGPT